MNKKLPYLVFVFLITFFLCSCSGVREKNVPSETLTIDSYPYKCILQFGNEIYETAATFDRAFFDRHSGKIGEAPLKNLISCRADGLSVLDASGNVVGKFEFKSYGNDDLGEKILGIYMKGDGSAYVAVFESDKDALARAQKIYNAPVFFNMKKSARRETLNK